MKKIIALLLSLILVLGLLSGCVTKKVKVVDENDKKTSSRKDTDDETEKEEEEEEETTPTKKEEEEQVTPPVQTGYVRGISSTTGWKSEYLGLQFKAPSSMIMSTEEEMKELMKLGAEATGIDLSDPAVNYALLNVVYEMMAMDTSGNSVMVIAEKPALSNITIEQYMEAVTSQLENMQDLNYSVSDVDKVDLWNKDFHFFAAARSVNGITMTQYYLCTKVDDRIISIIITDVTGDGFDKIYDAFSEC